MESPALFEITPSSESWHTRRRVGFDLETTSRFPHEARIVSAALVIFDPADQEEVRVREWLVDPGVEIPPATTAIHGISTEYAQAEGQPAAEAVPQIVVELTKEIEAGSAIVVMNAPYDFTVLQAEAQRYGVGFPVPRPVIDPLVIDKQVDKFRRGKRTLGDLCGVYQVILDGAHTAGADAKAAVEVADCLARNYPQLQVPAEVLHDLQVQWKAEQAADFQQFLRRTKPDAVIEPSWPVAAQVLPGGQGL
ncbi:3'-5' exonuclease [Nesterenkonia flava]|uniref:3'-5' exonuclease n=1 Tax=Nesterenkonia flava TaxID=469799 RepID=A0ABU1FRR5_9MICC|nr:3'-5' exonuclease [Nesterenkonia flava]MDR5710846.1 3'-5' exonuclease [Nesterenkonia flava]